MQWSDPSQLTRDR